MEIFDFSNAEYSNRNGSYGGAAGDKDGILINRKYVLPGHINKKSAVKSLYQSGRLRGTMRLYGNGMMSKDCQESHETLQESRR